MKIIKAKQRVTLIKEGVTLDKGDTQEVSDKRAEEIAAHENSKYVDIIDVPKKAKKEATKESGE